MAPAVSRGVTPAAAKEPLFSVGREKPAVTARLWSAHRVTEQHFLSIARVQKRFFLKDQVLIKQVT